MSDATRQLIAKHAGGSALVAGPQQVSHGPHFHSEGSLCDVWLFRGFMHDFFNGMTYIQHVFLGKSRMHKEHQTRFPEFSATALCFCGRNLSGKAFSR